VCRQIAEEFWKFCMRHTTKHFANSDPLVQTGLKVLPQHLRRISLGFTNDAYFRLLGLECQRHDGLCDLPDGSVLSLVGQIPTLFELHFHFEIVRPRERYNDWKSSDPWAYIHFNSGTDLVSCQKTFVHWFFTMALADLRGIESITISGHVKNSTRRHWKQTFDAERKGHTWDNSQEVQEILSTDWQQLYVFEYALVASLTRF
jgi:hypothetical protein